MILYRKYFLYHFLFFITLVLHKIQSKSTVDITIDGKTFSVTSENIIDEDTELKSGVFSTASNDEPIFIIRGKSKLTLGENVSIKKNIWQTIIPIIPNIFPAGSQTYNENNNYIDEEIDSEKDKYGLYSAILVIGEGSVTINGAKIETNCTGCKAISVLENSNINFLDGNIKTHKSNSSAFYSYGGKITSDNMEIITNGNYSPAILTITNEEISLSNLNITTKGYFSPLFYLNGNNIIVSTSDGKSEKSQIALIEGNSKITLNYCEFFCYGKNENSIGVMIYNKNEINGIGNFESVESSLYFENEENEIPMFLITNSVASVVFSDSETNVKKEGTFTRAKNKGTVNMSVKGKTIIGKIYADDDSKVDLEFEEGLDSSGISLEGNANKV